MSLNARQKRFIAEYLTDLNGQRAAIAAGYSPRGAKVAASRLLTDVNVKALVQKKQDELARSVEIRREDIVRGLLETIAIAREQGDAQAMIKAAAEISKLLGFYSSDKRRIEARSPSGEAGLQCLSDRELLRMIKRQGGQSEAGE